MTLRSFVSTFLAGWLVLCPFTLAANASQKPKDQGRTEETAVPPPDPQAINKEVSRLLLEAEEVEKREAFTPSTFRGPFSPMGSLVRHQRMASWNRHAGPAIIRNWKAASPAGLTRRHRNPRASFP